MAGEDNYFRTPAPVWLILVPFGMGLHSMAYLAPELVPYNLLGPLGTFTRYLVQQHPTVLMFIFYTAWVLHVIEAYIAKQKAKRKNLSEEASWKWAIQTFVYGIFSLSLLNAYKPKLNRN